MQKLLVALCTTGLVAAFGSGIARAAPSSPPPSCDNDNGQAGAHNPNCPAEEEPAGCPPATGPLSSVVQQISDAIRDGGGAPLADLIDQINCALIVGVLGL